MASDIGSPSGGGGGGGGSDLGLSGGSSSIPLGASATALFSSLRNPQFMSLMDSFRDIAETNSWDKLDPAQIQGLMDSFKIGDHDKFGLEPEMYEEIHTSFNHFLSQLNNRFLTGSSASSPQLSEYSRYGNHSNAAVVAPPHNMGGINGGLMSKFHGAPHQLDMVSPLVSAHQASPPSGFCPSNRTPTPPGGGPHHAAHTSPTQGTSMANLPSGSSSAQQQHNMGGPPRYGSYAGTGHTPPMTSSVVPPSVVAQEGMPIRSAATELFDDDDDFDWSKLM